MTNIASLTARRAELETACTNRPEDMALFTELADVLEKLGAYQDLVCLLDKGIQLWPQDNELETLRCRIQIYLGDQHSARTGYLRVLERDPANIHAVCAMVDLGHGEEVGGLQHIDALLAQHGPSSSEHIRLCYARARLLEQSCRYDEAFAELREANAGGAAAGGMDISAKQRGARAVIRDLTPDVVQRFSGFGNQSKRPIFIVGMPRSGTSLTEQIVASHPHIHGAGEQLFWGETLRELVTGATRSDCPMVEAIHSMGAGVWDEAGEHYLQCMAEIESTSKRITDKLPANFGLLPFIRLVFPRAHIIHVRRNPLAVIASCIRTHFADPSLSFTVEDWARFHGLYQALMERWRPLLAEQMLEVEYEELVSDLPTQARRIISFLGLAWDDACLSPESNPRAVRTASARQIRRSVHSDAIDAWRCYRVQLQALQPLIEESYAFINED